MCLNTTEGFDIQESDEFASRGSVSHWAAGARSVNACHAFDNTFVYDHGGHNTMGEKIRQPTLFGLSRADYLAEAFFGPQALRLERKYASRLREELALGALVSYVGNKEVPLLRLYRYKEKKRSPFILLICGSAGLDLEPATTFSTHSVGWVQRLLRRAAGEYRLWESTDCLWLRSWPKRYRCSSTFGPDNFGRPSNGCWNKFGELRQPMWRRTWLS